MNRKRWFKPRLITVGLMCILVLALTTVAAADVAPDDRPEPDASEQQTGASSYELPFRSAPSNTPSGFLTEAQNGRALDIALGYIKADYASYDLTAADVANLVVTDLYVSDESGVTHIYLRQEIDGIEVFGSTSDIHVTADGRVVKFGNRFFKNIRANINTTQPSVAAAEAIVQTAAALGVDYEGELAALSRSTTAAQEATFSGSNLSQDDIPVKLMYHPMPDGTLQLVWDMVFNMKINDDWLNLRVDAQTGAIISQDNWTIYETEPHHHTTTTTNFSPTVAEMRAEMRAHMETVIPAEQTGQITYEVYPIPLRDPDEGPRELLEDPSDATASPYGWHDFDGVEGAEFIVARGNNVWAYEDPFNDNNFLSNYTPNGGADLLFSYPIDLTQHPSTYRDASITNLFYLNNVIHDVFYHYGFDEASGNFQFDTYGRGGIGGDPVLAEAQDGGGFTNANFATPPDGNLPRMQMYLGGPDANGVVRDGSLDNHVVIHEYGHGISNRLVGGPANICLGSVEQGGEGWSDWLGLVMIADVGDTGAMPITVGNWLNGEGPNGAGFRPYPYSTSFGVNPSTFADVSDANTFSQPHGIGTIWASMMWEMYWNLVDRDGFDPDLYSGTGGNNLAIQLVIDGLKYTSCFPSFTDQRNGILTADLVNNPVENPQEGYPQSQNECLIWEAFAKRGLGYSADAGSAFSRFDQTEAFDLPPQCQASENFTLNVTPPAVEICATDGSALYTADLSAYLGYDQTVSLSADNLPGAATSSFSPMSATAPYTSAVTIGNTNGVATGSYDIDIIADDTSTTITKTVTLDVFDATPGTITPVEPLTGTTGISPLNALLIDWSDDATASSYTVEVAEDMGFSTLVYTATVGSSQATVPQNTLEANTTYYWRALAENLCGQGAYTDVSMFSTGDYAAILLVDGDGGAAPTTATFAAALEDLGANYDLWDAGFGAADAPLSSTLSNYAAVIWNGSDLNGIDEAGEAELASYLDSGGGCFFVSAQDYHYAFGNTDFMDTYLGVADAEDDVQHTTVTGANNFAAFGPYGLLFPGSYSGNWSDLLTPDEDANAAFTGNGGAGGAAALYKETANYKTSFWAFPFEAVPSASERALLMQGVLDWCGLGDGLSLSAISLTKTVGLDANECGTSSSLIVPSGTDVTYCYSVINQGSITQTLHTLVDDQLGTLLSDFAFDLAPGASVEITQTANIVTNTTNVATWSTVDADMGTAEDTDEAAVYVFDTVQSFDSCIDFESGSLPSSMVPIVDEFGVANGRVTVDGSNPFNGNFAMNLDTDSSGIAFTNQAAVLAVDLNGQTDAELYFWVSNQGDENHAQDGVFFSDDNGATYTKVLSFNNYPAQYVNVHLDIDQLAADNGLSLNDNFLIKFQAFDNFPLGQDGYSIDDICVQPATPTLYYSSKSAPEQVTTGDTFTYTVNIVNTGLLTATGVIVSDTVPVGTTYVANSVSASSGTAGEIAGIVGWTGDVGVNQAVALTFEVTVTAAAGDTITNTAAIMHSSLPADLERHAVTEVVAAEPAITYDANQARVSLASDQTVSQTLTIGNVGFAALNWTAYETDCTTPADIGWLEVSPTSGTIGRDESSDLLLTFDSTGLSSGVYTDILCLATDDPNAAEVNIPVHLVVNNVFSINFTATVGTDPNSCAASSTVNNVSPGSEVTYCYQIENTSTVAFDTHELSELTAGVLLTDTVTTITPGETVTITATQTLTDSVTLDLTWMASNGGFIATDSDTVTVNVGTTLYLPVINRP